MDWSYLYTSFEGRISRKPYWIGALTLLAVGLPVQLLILFLAGETLAIISGLFFLYPSFAVNVKRAHDRNRPTWLIAAFFALLIVINAIQLAGLDQVGEQPTLLYLVVGLPWFALAMFLFIDLGFLRGTPGPNQYGPDPLASG